MVANVGQSAGEDDDRLGRLLDELLAVVDDEDGLDDDLEQPELPHASATPALVMRAVGVLGPEHDLGAAAIGPRATSRPPRGSARRRPVAAVLPTIMWPCEPTRQYVVDPSWSRAAKRSPLCCLPCDATIASAPAASCTVSPARPSSTPMAIRRRKRKSVGWPPTATAPLSVPVAMASAAPAVVLHDERAAVLLRRSQLEGLARRQPAAERQSCFAPRGERRSGVPVAERERRAAQLELMVLTRLAIELPHDRPAGGSQRRCSPIVRAVRVLEVGLDEALLAVVVILLDAPPKRGLRIDRARAGAGGVVAQVHHGVERPVEPPAGDLQPERPLARDRAAGSSRRWWASGARGYRPASGRRDGPTQDADPPSRHRRTRRRPAARVAVPAMVNRPATWRRVIGGRAGVSGM